MLFLEHRRQGGPVGEASGGDKELEPEDAQARGAAVLLLEQHWPEIEAQLRRTYLRDFEQDPSLGNEVFLRMLVRLRNGGGIVRFVRAEPGRPMVGMLVGHARFIVREIFKHKPPNVASLDAIMEVNEPLASSPWQGAPPQEKRATRDRRAADQLVAGLPATAANVEAIMDAIHARLARGEEAWQRLCDVGVLDPADWTEHQKWTAIGTMWGFRARYIALIRYAMVEADVGLLEEPHRTVSMVSAVRKKGQRLFGRASRAFPLMDDPPLDEEPDAE